MNLATAGPGWLFCPADRPERFDVDKIAGVAGHEELADPVATENKLRRHAAVSAGDDRRPRRLMSGDVATALGEIHGAKFGMAHEAFVARLELRERFLRGKRSRRAFRRARRRRHASGHKRDRGGGAELHQIPPADPVGFAIAAHRPPSLTFGLFCEPS